MNNIPDDQSIAVIGMSARFPGANNINEFWENLRIGRDTITHFSDAELRQAKIPENLIQNPSYIKRRGILEDIDKFDADFFGISPYEAAMMDPQQRVFLEICWEALECAGYTSTKSKLLIGVYAGMSDSSYLQNCLLKNTEFLASHQPTQTTIANSCHFLATKVSYYLDLRGPSLNINTACSTSLAAIIEACKALVNGDCDIALAGGVTIIVPQISGYLYQDGSILSRDGKCHTFDKNASGTVSSNGAGVVVLKRLTDAISDGDAIDAVIKGYAINNDGNAKASYAAPSILEQSRCIAMALSTVDVESVGYIEAHGTGTLLGDPVEIKALTKAFRHYTDKKQYCAIGSVKTNIGHTDTAAGVAGFIKTVLALKNKIIPASLYYSEPNPHIQFEESPFYVNAKQMNWKESKGKRCAGVSSFGIGGTNTHVILEESPTKIYLNSAKSWQIILLSAKTSDALNNQKKLLLKYLIDSCTPSIQLSDIAYTLQIGRKDFEYRHAIVWSNRDQLIVALQNSNNVLGYQNTFVLEKKPKLIFIFSERESIYAGIIKHQYFNDSLFKSNVNKCLECLPKNLQISALNYLIDDKDQLNKALENIIKKICLFVVDYCIADMLLSWNIVPDVIVGYESGEYIAACLSKVFGFKEAIALALRSWMQESSFKIDNELMGFISISDKVEYKNPVIPYLSNINSEQKNEIKNSPSVFMKICMNLDALEYFNHSDEDGFCSHIWFLPSEKEYLKNPELQQFCIENALAKAWICKIPINWNAYHGSCERHRVHLPTYPFEKTKHWIDPSVSNVSKHVSRDPKVPHIYEPYWELSVSNSKSDSVDLSGNYLIFADEKFLQNNLIKKLATKKREIICVIQGDKFSEISNNVYQINPNSKNDYQQLFLALQTIKKLPKFVIHCWSLKCTENKSTLEISDLILKDGFLSLVYFSQVFISINQSEKTYLTVITNKLKKIHPNDEVIPEKYTLLGISLVLPQEYQALCRVIDSDALQLNSSELSSFYHNIMLDGSYNPEELFVAYRSGIKFINKFKEYSNNQEIKQSIFAVNGVYLITGGLGKIGLELAEFLAEKYSAHIILVSRSGSDRAEAVCREPDYSYRLSNIKSKAKTLSIVKADVTNFDQMQEVFKEIKLKHKKIDAIFHLAGVVNSSTYHLVKDLTNEEIYRQFLPKIQGVKVIEALTNQLPVDFCILFSSLASIVGGIGFASYSSANCCLDGFSEYHQNNRKTRWISLNWDVWDFSTKISGINSSVFEEHFLNFQHGYRYIISSNNLRHKIIENINKNNLLCSDSKQDDLFFETKKLSIEDTLKQIFKECLQVSEVNNNDDFYHIGGDSLSAIRLLELIEKRFNRISMSELIENSSILKLKNLIEKKKDINFSSIVILKKEGRKPPLFLIHPIGGTVFCYIELMKYLNNDRPCYGIQDPGIHFSDVHFSSIPEIASFYLQEIKSIQSKGPYLLGGYSFGGSIAFEVARQLEQNGEDVSRLLLIDSWAVFSNELKQHSKFCEIMEFILEDMKNYISDSIQDKKKLLDLAWSRMQLLFDYVPNVIAAPITLMKARDILPEYSVINETANHWQSYARNPINIYNIAGNHKSLLSAKGVEQLASIINQI